MPTSIRRVNLSDGYVWFHGAPPRCVHCRWEGGGEGYCGGAGETRISPVAVPTCGTTLTLTRTSHACPQGIMETIMDEMATPRPVDGVNTSLKDLGYLCAS